MVQIEATPIVAANEGSIAATLGVAAIEKKKIKNKKIQKVISGHILWPLFGPNRGDPSSGHYWSIVAILGSPLLRRKKTKNKNSTCGRYLVQIAATPAVATNEGVNSGHFGVAAIEKKKKKQKFKLWPLFGPNSSIPSSGH